MYQVFLWLGLGLLTLLSFHGTARNASGTTIRFLGMTLYERLRNRALPAPTVTFALDWQGRRGRRSERRNLRERLRDAGMPVIRTRSTRLSDVGGVRVLPNFGEGCYHCGANTCVLLEVVREQEAGTRIDRAACRRVCAVCENCGFILSVEKQREARKGRIAPHVRSEGNLFDVLDLLEEDGFEGTDMDALEARRDRLEVELGGVRAAITRGRQLAGAGDAFRDADRALPPSVSGSNDN